MNKFLKYIFGAPLEAAGELVTEKVGESFATSCVSLIDSSYWLFLGLSMAALFLYVAGEKWAKKYATCPPLLYFLLQLVKISLN